MHSTTKVIPNSTDGMPDKSVSIPNKILSIPNQSVTDGVLAIDEDEKDLRYVLSGNRYIIDAINSDELRLKRIKPNEIITSIENFDKHIQAENSASKPQRDVLERIISAAQKQLALMS